MSATSGVVASLTTGGTVGDAAGDTFLDIENFVGSHFSDLLNGDDKISGWEDGVDIISFVDNTGVVRSFGDLIITQAGVHILIEGQILEQSLSSIRQLWI